jgi:hypothetical protein
MRRAALVCRVALASVIYGMVVIVDGVEVGVHASMMWLYLS